MFCYKIFANKKFVYLFYLLCLVQTLTRFQVHAHTNSSKPITYFVLSEDYPLKSNFEFVPANSRLILIAKLATYVLTDAQKKRFDAIIFIDHFDVQHIETVVIDSYYNF
ncbi:hypothetical protein ACRRVB_00590 [Candidatus Cardinium hertigii]|uniref:hypothetical protein n=1 Tax=Candidatus Cardinium hertigii TaxID=247481 RepID=UPI003D7D9503